MYLQSVKCLLMTLHFFQKYFQKLFSRNVNSDDHPKLTFNGNQVQQCLSPKHLGFILDNKLDFNKHLDEKINKCNKIIGMMKKLSISVSRQSLLTIYKSFVRPILDYGDIIYDKPHKGSFIEIIERVQYNASLVITGAFKGTSRAYLSRIRISVAQRWKMTLENVFFLQNCERTFA